MVDKRFFPPADPVSLHALLQHAGHDLSAAEERWLSLTINGVDELHAAGPGHIALAGHASYREQLVATLAGAVIVSPAMREAVPQHAIPVVAERPHDLFADLLDYFHPLNTRALVAGGIDNTGIPPVIEEGVILGPNVVLGPGVEIGRNTIVGANTVVGTGVAVGRDCTIGSNCTLDCAYLGNRVVLHPGARIGTEGFGWLDFGTTNRKIPQLGRVVIQDDVEIGANSTIDRGALGDTVIGQGTKIDNLVQIGHNCRIGRYCLIAATTGLSGSTVLGDGVLVGGGVGTSGHLSIGAGSIVHGRAAVTKDWPEGSKLAGAPAQDVREFWREIATVRRLAKGNKR